MADPFLGELRIMSFGFAPKGWALCNGQVLPINQNQALFSLLGTNYGGNGTTNFNLPNLQGRTPLHFGAGIVLGQAAGEQAHTLTIPEMPSHTHGFQASADPASQPLGVGAVPAVANNLYQTAAAPLVALAPAVVANVGGSQAHENMQPFLTLNFCIALQGIFPSRS